MINLVIHGYNGKLGKRVIENLHNHPNVKFIGYIDRLYDFTIIKINKNVVLLDVTSDEGCKNLLTNLIKENINKPLIIGSTGNLPNELINEYSKNNTIYEISNFSKGMNSILNFLPSIKLDNCSYELSETHHTRKKDMPSGTAKSIAKQINFNIDQIKSIREGNVFGIHELIIENDYEKIIIKHEVKDPNVFAIGCIKSIIEIFSNNKLGYYKV